MPSVLVIGSAENGQLTTASLEAASLGATLASDSNVPLRGALFGHGLEAASARFATAGFESLSVIDDQRLSAYVGDLALAAVMELVARSGAETIIVPADANAVEWAPRLAARLTASLASNCLGARVENGAIVASRAIAGGALQAEYRLASQVRILLLGPGLEPASASSEPCAIAPIALPAFESRTELLDFIPDQLGSGPQLKNARIVVSGGMGIGSAENWSLIERTASVLSAAVGATRAAVEVGWAPPSSQVGFSGLKIGPDLYVAIGISGALHHLAGIGRAKRIVAINTDLDANIFRASHLGVIGDAKEVVPAFVERIGELQA